MAENLSVFKAISTLLAPFGSNKNVVIRANIANIVDSMIVRFDFIAFHIIARVWVVLLGNLPPTPTLPIIRC